MTSRDFGAAYEPADPGTKRYDPTQDQEKARRNIAYVLCGLLALIFAAVTIALLFADAKLERIKEVTIVIGPLAGLAGTAMGFYFAQKR